MSSNYDTSWLKIKKVFVLAGISIMAYYLIDNSAVLNEVFFNYEKKTTARNFLGFMIFSIIKYVLIIAAVIFSGLTVFLIYKRNSSRE